MNRTGNIQDHLVIQAQKGDDQARAALYNQFRVAMFSICVRMLGDTEEAEDLLQDAFIHAFQHLKQLKNPASFPGWLRQIVVNRCIRQTKKRVRWVELPEDGEILEKDQQNWWTGIELETIAQEIAALPDGCRQIFTLFVLEDFTHKQIAESMEISESTSKSQYQRARQLLRTRISEKIFSDGRV